MRARNLAAATVLCVALLLASTMAAINIAAPQGEQGGRPLGLGRRGFSVQSHNDVPAPDLSLLSSMAGGGGGGGDGGGTTAVYFGGDYFPVLPPYSSPNSGGNGGATDPQGLPSPSSPPLAAARSFVTFSRRASCCSPCRPPSTPWRTKWLSCAQSIWTLALSRR